MDGTSVHIDGSWHEVKTGVVYEGVADQDGMGTGVHARYVAAQEPAERFGQRLYVSATQAGVEHAPQVVVLGEGAEWLWNQAQHHYPAALKSWTSSTPPSTSTPWPRPATAPRACGASAGLRSSAAGSPRADQQRCCGPANG